MNLNQLRYFQMVCKYNNITQAANYLHVSQPSISEAIKELEEKFGTTLFERRNRGMILTSEGMILLNLVDNLLESVNQMEQIMSELGKKRKFLRLGISPMASALLLPKIYSEFFLKHPDLKFSITESGQSALIQQLDKNELDLLIIPHNSPFLSTYQSIPLMQLEIVCCISKTHSWAGKLSIAITELEKEPIILFSKDFFHTKYILDCFREKKLIPNIVLNTGQLSTICNAVIHKLGVGFMFRQIAEKNENMIGISLQPPMTTQLSLVWQKERKNFYARSQFIDYVKSCNL